MLSTVALWQVLHPISTWNNHSVRTLLVHSALCSLQPAERCRQKAQAGGSVSQKGANPERGGEQLSPCNHSRYAAILPFLYFGAFYSTPCGKLYPMWHLQWCNKISAPRSSCLVWERTRVTGHQVRLSASWSLSKGSHVSNTWHGHPPSQLWTWTQDSMVIVLLNQGRNKLYFNAEKSLSEEQQPTWCNRNMEGLFYSSDILSWVCSSHNL